MSDPKSTLLIHTIDDLSYNLVTNSIRTMDIDSFIMIRQKTDKHPGVEGSSLAGHLGSSPVGNFLSKKRFLSPAVSSILMGAYRK